MRLRIDLGYDGRAFHGWASQPGLRTVQGEIEAALATVLRSDPPQVTVAGRTDTGVHARGQVLHVDVDPAAVAASRGHADRPVEQTLLRRLNGVLPADVRVHGVREAAPGFDARFSALWRRYAYRLADRPELVDPLSRGHVTAWGRPLDEARMSEAGRLLVGERDFAAYCKRREGASTVRTLIGVECSRHLNGILVAEVRADAFCHSMVRSLMGALVAVGEGRRGTSWPADVLARGERDGGVLVMPAHGLVLEEVGYPADDALAAQADRARVVRTLTLQPGGEA
ncbi:tRNA pseudouridine synthase A [Marmoricola endophyticus]|uniref:tRNA pseudouridine synthase A n=1 Tax=Marmoricola endophyticus TaxID=2040280 RepID=A0A917BG54_9ACTN|nr:tRNA pseudouridine(38-40) synthase TruA [Marmoricola endophyticus]GGF42799.1 tRNA pseudouridine synthase A [Marmoricola endophyticus]